MAEMTPEEMRAWIEAAPPPLEDPPIIERDLPDGVEEGSGYEMAARATARALLIIAEERPELLDVSAERERDTTGYEAADNRKLWEAAKERWPGLDDWLSGITGFQYGYAHNAVRYALGAKPVGNPAIMTIGTRDDDE